MIRFSVSNKLDRVWALKQGGFECSNPLELRVDFGLFWYFGGYFGHLSWFRLFRNGLVVYDGLGQVQASFLASRYSRVVFSSLGVLGKVSRVKIGVSIGISTFLSLKQRLLWWFWKDTTSRWVSGVEWHQHRGGWTRTQLMGELWTLLMGI